MTQPRLQEMWLNCCVILRAARRWARPHTIGCCRTTISRPWNAPLRLHFRACNSQFVRKPGRHNLSRWAKENPLVNLLFRDHRDAVYAASVLECGVRAWSDDDETVGRNLLDLCPCLSGAPPWHSALSGCATSGLDDLVLRVCRLLMGEYGVASHHDRSRQPDLHVLFHPGVLLHHHDCHRLGEKALLVMYGSGRLSRLRLGLYVAGMAAWDRDIRRRLSSRMGGWRRQLLHDCGFGGNAHCL